MKAASRSVGVPSALPGKTRFMFCPSKGDSLRPFSEAGKLIDGAMMMRPLTVSGEIDAARRRSTIWASYSSPWMPPHSSTDGPLPLLMQHRISPDTPSSAPAIGPRS